MLWNSRRKRKFELDRTGIWSQIGCQLQVLANTVHRIDHKPGLISTVSALRRCAQRHVERAIDLDLNLDLDLDGAVCFLFS